MNKQEYILPDHKAEGRRSNPAGRSVFELKSEQKNLGNGKTYFIRTYGCQANVRDGETLSGMLEEMGFQPAEGYEDADLTIFNTCAVRHAAEEHVLGEIGSLRPFKEAHPDKIFALCGCMAQEEGIVKDLIRKYPQVDLVFGTHNIARFPDLLEEAMNGKRTIEVTSNEGSVIENLPVHRSHPWKGFVNIMYGCNKFCTYCIVPYTRGRERSRLESYIIEETRQLKKRGGKEVTLLGQNVNAYGKDLGMEDGFTHLLRKVSETGIDRIRFYSSHPRDYSVTTIDAMRDCPNIMPALHLPVQSGCDEILKRMNRGYTAEHFRKLFDDMKARIPDLTFTTDLIVGFPGETDEQFQETLDLVDYCHFDSAFTFVYSPREGTPAAAMEDNVPLSVKKERLQILNERIGKYARENNEAAVGKTLKVLCDGPSKKNENVLCGYSEENRLVNFTGNGIQAGEICDVKITEARSFSLYGEAL